jgi:uncharacterized cupredoxin-like copper-binding protein
VLLGGCSSGQPARAARAVSVTERDFHITAPADVASGRVRLWVHNLGPEAHELIVVRMSSDQPLPFRADGLTIDEDKVEKATIGVLEPGRAGSIRHVDLDLPAGRYEMFCNMSGHFKAGMHHSLVVQ